MFSWLPYSFVRITIFFTTGILLGIYIPEAISVGLAIILVLTGSLLFSVFAYLKFIGRLTSFPLSFFGLATLIVAGYLHVELSTEIKWLSHFNNLSKGIQNYRAVIDDQAQEKQNSWRVEGKVSAIKNDSGWLQSTGKVQLYFSKKGFKEPFKYGDVLLVKGSPQELTEPANPGEFNYKRFLSFNAIYHQHFLRGGEVVFINHDPDNFIYDVSLLAREWARVHLLKNIDGEYERAVVSALVLGIKDELDNELTNAYASSGAMHVLAVSGLHVGIVYAILFFVLRPLNKVKYGKWILAGICIAVLWMYAFITGLSPSVLRAVSMFSFIALARPMNQHTNIYNTLAVSAFCLLLWDPYLIMSVGFQLSYLAVIGIIYVQPKIYHLFNPHNLIMSKVWEISSVSIAAQISTFLLGLLYYHQFPVYFLVSNLFVIPGAIAVLVLGIGVLAFSFLSPVAWLLGFILNWLVWLLNFLVFQVEKLPYSLIENIYITTPQCWFLMIALLSLFYIVDFRKPQLVFLTAICMILFAGVQWQRFYSETNTRQFLVYKVAGHTAFDFIDKGRAYFYTDSTLLKNSDRIRFHIRPNRLQSGVHSVQYNKSDLVKELPGARLIRWNGLTIAQLHSDSATLPMNLSVDYVIVSNNAVKKVDQLSSIKAKMLVLDSSNSLYFANQILKQASDVNMNIHSVLHQGAFKLVF
jgi:competence protein ComEC